MSDKMNHARWFSMALKALIVLAENESRCPSGKLAEKLESQSVYLRKILTHLVKAGIISAKEGRDGGYTLGKKPEDIMLSEVYEAIRAETVVKDYFETEGKHCFSDMSQQSLCDLQREMETWILQGLQTKALSDLIEQ
ncbi:Rrf2 family transcriptional regulator [Halobacillus sp. Nhm2S1]|uniref:RrF2 family transcriptional regulator n=1 Tax=Halobacillus sp. Nhm2S1 TaxID=2866716 RepID=UPI001C736877|nr:Rrf2 family transcriptional regulator [Halobacillus sp. Nhm2S1]MBX0359533.1 Rrf2 family transcriptional regulator [Halobacillus sp. Nhm2S1]